MWLFNPLPVLVNKPHNSTGDSIYLRKMFMKRNEDWYKSQVLSGNDTFNIL